MRLSQSPGPWEVQPPTLIEELIRLGTPFLSAEEANQEVIRLTLDNMRLQALLDAKETP